MLSWSASWVTLTEFVPFMNLLLTSRGWTCLRSFGRLTSILRLSKKSTTEHAIYTRGFYREPTMSRFVSLQICFVDFSLKWMEILYNQTLNIFWKSSFFKDLYLLCKSYDSVFAQHQKNTTVSGQHQVLHINYHQ